MRVHELHPLQSHPNLDSISGQLAVNFDRARIMSQLKPWQDAQLPPAFLSLTAVSPLELALSELLISALSSAASSLESALSDLVPASSVAGCSSLEPVSPQIRESFSGLVSKTIWN